MPDSSPSKDGWNGVGTGWTVTSTLIAGMLALGGLGFLVDRLAGTDQVFLAIGIVLGAATGVYAVYLRWGKKET